MSHVTAQYIGICTFQYSNIAIENGHRRLVELPIYIYLFKAVIFHSYVNVYQRVIHEPGIPMSIGVIGHIQW